MIMKRTILLLIASAALFSSCKKELQDPGGTATKKLAGEWWVQLFNPDGSLAYPADYYGHILTYNTAANTNEIWVDDNGEIWDFKVKAQADPNNLSFSATDATSVVPCYGIKVNITDGKVLPLAAKSKTGNATDSIYMKIEFEDDPGSIYTLRGHLRTGFLEDEYH